MPGSTEDLGSAEIIVLQEVKGLTKDQQRAFFGLQNPLDCEKAPSMSRAPHYPCKQLVTFSNFSK